MSSEPSSTAAIAGLALAAEEAAPPYGERPQQDQTVRVLNPLTLRVQTRAAGPAAVESLPRGESVLTIEGHE